MPVITRAVINFAEPNRLHVETGNVIAVIDDRPELQFIKGQNMKTFEIGTFPRTIVDLQQNNNNNKHTLRESFRRDAGGSAFGQCWGGSSGTEGGVQLRSKTLGSIQTERKGKCNSEAYAKERRFTANKQFAYNKLKVDRATSLTSPTHKGGKPERPPAPNVTRSPTSEGVLIDLSPEEMGAKGATNFSGAQQSKICILDEPIDVPTIGAVESSDESAWEVVERRPPPFQSPPSYSNTMKMIEASPAKTVRVTNFDDPFCTAHISSNGVVAAKGFYPRVENVYENKEAMSRSANYGQLKASTSSEFDQIATRMTASSSPKNSAEFGNLTSMTSLTSTDSGIVSQSLIEDETPNDSFAGMTLMEEKSTLDKSFLADLEKNIYKHGGVTNINDNQMYSTKETTKNFNNVQYSPGARKNLNTVNCLAKPQQQLGYKSYDSTATFTNKQFVGGENVYGNYAAGGNFYSSVAGDLYGSGNFYEAPSQGTYSNYGAIPRPKSNLHAASSFSAIDLSNTSRELTPAIYDEVADDAFRPIRAAPLPPGLSHQQIQRRLEKQQQQVVLLCNELGEGSEVEAEVRLALEASNWDNSSAIRHFKIERLFR